MSLARILCSFYVIFVFTFEIMKLSLPYDRFVVGVRSRRRKTYFGGSNDQLTHTCAARPQHACQLFDQFTEIDKKIQTISKH
jgi:hypothetical protein